MKYLVCLLFFVAACGSSNDGPAGPAASEEIDAAGGSVSVQQGSLSGAGINVPANAVDAPTTFTIRSGSDVEAGAGTTRVGPAVRFGPATTEFNSAIMVTIPYSPGQAGSSDVLVVQRDDVTGGLTFHNTPNVDAANGLVSVNTMRFSTFQAYTAPAAATFDMTGFWVASTSNNFSVPPGDEDPDATVLVEVTQNGNSVTIEVQGDDSGDPETLLTGTVDGADYSVTGGSDTIEFTLTDADSGSGTLTFDDDGEMGGADITFTRQESATFDIAGSWDVEFSNNASTPPGNEDANETVGFTFTQTGTTWTLQADSDQRSGFLSGASYFARWAEVNQALNDVEVMIEFNFTDADNGTGAIVAFEELPNGDIIERTADLTATRQN